MRKLRRVSTTQRVKGPTQEPHEAMDELTEQLTRLGVADVDVSYHCREGEMFDYWSATATIAYWASQ